MLSDAELACLSSRQCSTTSTERPHLWKRVASTGDQSMASASRKTSTSQADIVLLPSLKNCLVNLPSSLVGLLLNLNAVVQNVVVELNFKPPSPSAPDGKSRPAGSPQSVFLGWTGMRSQTRTGSLIRRDGSGRQDQEVPIVEVDSTYGKLLGLTEGTKVSITRSKMTGALWLTTGSRCPWHCIWSLL